MGIIAHEKIDNIISKLKLDSWKYTISSKISKIFCTRYFCVLERYESGYVPIASHNVLKHKDKYNIQKLSILELNELFEVINSRSPVENISGSVTGKVNKEKWKKIIRDILLENTII